MLHSARGILEQGCVLQGATVLGTLLCSPLHAGGGRYDLEANLYSYCWRAEIKAGGLRKELTSVCEGEGSSVSRKLCPHLQYRVCKLFNSPENFFRIQKMA